MNQNKSIRMTKKQKNKANTSMFIEEESKIEELKTPLYGGDSDDDDDDEPETRELLPNFMDPKVKISIWTIIKDSIGKDISKMSVPVYFNDTTGILQRCAATMEYVNILDKATAE
jgi:hypothetical protein